jgi:DnaK suppressor protein
MARSRSASAHSPQPDPERPDDALTHRLPALQAALEQQHRFRREQLARLEGYGERLESGTGADPADPADPEAVLALREVDALLEAGARRALADIELALVRMHTGRYGYCRSCSATIPVPLLEAIPKTTLCLACRFRDERGRGPQGPRRTSPTVRRRRRRTDGSVGPARQRW